MCPDNSDVQRAVTQRPALELSKIYVLPGRHGGGVAQALMSAALGSARRIRRQLRVAGRQPARTGAPSASTPRTVSPISGTKTFRLGTRIENDYVMVRPV